MAELEEEISSEIELMSNSESTVANEVPKILKSRNLKVD